MASIQNGRPIAQFHPSIWGDIFLNYIPYDKETSSKMEEEIKKLKEEVKEDLLASVENPLQQLDMIDDIQRLGVAYHFEEIIEEIMEDIYNKSFKDYDDNQSYQQDDLYYTSLRFRLLRQHGFPVKCGIFAKFLNQKGKLEEFVTSDIEGLLSLYEASHVRTHNDQVLDQIMEVTTTYLESITNNLCGLIADKVNHALNQPLHKGMIRLESRYYIDMYKRDLMHNKSLLELAIKDFNFVQSLHRIELRDIALWWKELVSSYEFARDRLAEGFFWTLAAFYEPQYSLGRKIFFIIFLIASIIDDIYDAYGTYEELEMLTQLIHRWDKSSISQLPDYMKFVYEIQIDSFEQFKLDLDKEGKAHLVDYMIEQMKILCETYMQEARWRHKRSIPPYDEYVKNSGVSFGYDLGISVTFGGMGKLATKEALEWVKQQPKPVVSAGVIGRLKNDMGGNKFQQCRDHVVSAIECYMKEHDLSEHETRDKLLKHVEDCWKDINEAMLRPFTLPKPLLHRILELTRLVDVMYKGEDGYTNVSRTIQKKIALVLVDQVPL